MAGFLTKFTEYITIKVVLGARIGNSQADAMRAQGTGEERTMLLSEINLRDPYVLVHEGRYYLYGTRGATCWGPATGFDVYTGTDL